jgi:periplasmic protein TonB
MMSALLLAAALAASPPVAAPTAPIPARPNVPLARYMSNRLDYPAAALRNREQGRVGFALAIDSNGRVNGCRITASSGSSALDSTTCRILRSRARYTPARDARGVAVPDAYIGEIVWTLPVE